MQLLGSIQFYQEAGAAVGVVDFAAVTAWLEAVDAARFLE